MAARSPLPNSLDREVWPWIPSEATRDEKDRLLFAAKEARSPVIYPALMLALNAGMRDAENLWLTRARVGAFAAEIQDGV